MYGRRLETPFPNSDDADDDDDDNAGSGAALYITAEFIKSQKTTRTSLRLHRDDHDGQTDVATANLNGTEHRID